MGTKLKFLVADDPTTLEGLIEGLPFKVEVKSVYHHGGKIFCWFTMLDQNYLTKPHVEMTAPKKKTTRKKKTKKSE